MAYITIPGHQQFSRNHVLYWFHALNLFLPFLIFLGLSPVSYDFTPGGYPDTPARLHGPAEFRCLLLAIASWARWDSWAQILGSLGLERMNLKLRVPIFMANGQLQMVCRCVFFFTLTRSRYSFSWVSSITLAPMTYAFHQGILPVPCWHAFTQPPPLGKPGQTSLSIECTPRRPVSSPSPAMEASDVFGDFFDQNWPPFTMEPAAIASVKSEMFHVPFSASRKPLIVVFLHI